MTAITRDEWLKALTDAGHRFEDDQAALTVHELAQMLKIDDRRASEKMQVLVGMGKAIRTQKRTADSSGRVRFHVAYRLVT